MVEDSSTQHSPANRQPTAPIAKDSVTAGPALAAAAWPVRTKMPAPMVPPIPKPTRLSADNARLGACTSLPSSPSAASCFNRAVDFLAQKLANGYPLENRQRKYHNAPNEIRSLQSPAKISAFRPRRRDRAA